MQHFVGDFFDGCAHCIGGVDRADDSRPAFVSLAVFYTNALKIGNGNEVLPYLARESAIVEFFAQNSICFAQSVQTVARNRAKTTNTKSGAGERLTVNHCVRKSECIAYYANLVLVEKTNRLNEFEFHIFGQTAYVVVRLYTVGLENVGIDSSLRKERNAFEFRCFFIEHLNEFAADDLSLLLGFCNTCKKIKKTVSSIYIDQICIKLFAKNLNDLFALALAHKTVVNVYANELATNRFDEKCRNNRGIDATRKCQKNLFIAYLFANFAYLFVNKGFCQCFCSDALHIFGAFVRQIHKFSLPHIRSQIL